MQVFYTKVLYMGQALLTYQPMIQATVIYMLQTLGKKPTITMLSTSKNVLFAGHNPSL